MNFQHAVIYISQTASLAIRTAEDLLTVSDVLGATILTILQDMGMGAEVIHILISKHVIKKFKAKTKEHY